MIVVDASAVVEFLLNPPAWAAFALRLARDGETLHAPHLLDLEVAQVLRRHVRARHLNPRRGREALDDLADFPLTRYPHYPFLLRVWELKDNLTAYDAAYVALAEALDAPLVTRDATLARAHGHGAQIEVF